MLINGEVDIAQIARPLEDVELIRANERTLKLDQIPVAIDGIVFYVNPNLSIPGLSLSQAQDIYVGKITNWREVGGPNVAIVPFSLEPKAVGATRQALGDVADKLSPRVRIIRDNTGGVRQVASTPGGISFAGASTIIGQRSVRILSIARGASTAYVSPITSSGGINKQAWRDGTYPITRRLFIAIRRNGSLEEQAGVAYANLVLSEEGQRIIERAGFVSLYQPDP
jgi:phosphate transport system substrate-binding protein